MSLALRYSAVSDVGRVRSNNQDSGFAGEHLLMVADGVGGAASGDLASAVAVRTLRPLDNDPPADMLEALAGAIHRADMRLGEIIEDDPRTEGMGTTVTAVLFDGERMGLAHIGDSRSYLLREGELSQLTHDHTFVQTLIDEGRITSDEARTHPHRNLIMKVLDGRHEIEPDLAMHVLQAGDRIMLCSDGLNGFVSDETLRELLSDGTPDSAAVELVHAALDANSTDNVTVVVADVVDADTPVDANSAAASVGPLLVGSAAEQARGQMDDTASQPMVLAGHGGDDDPIDRELLRYAPRAPRRFGWLRRLLMLVVILALLAIGLLVAYRWSQEQYFVADEGSTVAIYQGVEADLLGVTLHHVEEPSDVRLDDLTPYWRTQVASGIEADSLDDARGILANLNEVADRCIAEREATASPTPERSPGPSPTRSPARSPAPSPTPTQTPTEDTPATPGAAACGEPTT
jgi:PPM family protein phosphatase